MRGKKIFLVQNSRTQRKILIVNACFRDISYLMGAYLAWQSCWISRSAKDGNEISSVDDTLVLILVVTTVSNDLKRELEKRKINIVILVIHKWKCQLQ
jgi:hypothetical protein